MTALECAAQSEYKATFVQVSGSTSAIKACTAVTFVTPVVRVACANIVNTCIPTFSFTNLKAFAQANFIISHVWACFTAN